jgi:ABC-2 type transport system ATP-binding protein
MIRLKELSKSFPGCLAVDRVSFSVGRGEAFALLGPNGAGKTTLMRILSTLSLPTSGEGTIAGFDLFREAGEIRRRIGIVQQHLNIDNDLTAEENLYLHARLHHLPASLARERTAELLAFVGLAEKKDVLVRPFSGGMKRRLMIARALLHRPELLFLDEPTVGLDPQVRRLIWDLLTKMRRAGMTLFLTTHYIEEAELLCQRVAIMDKGRLLTVDTPEALCARYGAYLVAPEGKTYAQSFFATEEEARRHAARVGAAAVRKTALEDVFVELTGKKADEL